MPKGDRCTNQSSWKVSLHSPRRECRCFTQPQCRLSIWGRCRSSHSGSTRRFFVPWIDLLHLLWSHPAKQSCRSTCSRVRSRPRVPYILLRLIQSCRPKTLQEAHLLARSDKSSRFCSKQDCGQSWRSCFYQREATRCWAIGLILKSCLGLPSSFHFLERTSILEITHIPLLWA